MTNVSVSCSTNTYTIGGTVSGLTGTVVLQNNSGDNESISSSGAFTFDTSLSNGASYAVTVLTQPTGQTCTVSNSSGTVASANVTNVSVSCSNRGGGNLPIMWTSPVMLKNRFGLRINGGAPITSSRNVVLEFNAATDIKEIAISMTGDFTDASQENYVASRPWDLCSKIGGLVRYPTCPDGIYTVHAKFYTAYGLSSAVAVASSTIILKSGAVLTNLQQAVNVPFTNPLTKKLRYKQTHADVKRLQIFLNSDPDTKLANSGVGSPGRETNYFGFLTLKSVIKFQEKHAKDVLLPEDLTKGTGYVGEATLAKINELIHSTKLSANID